MCPLNTRKQIRSVRANVPGVPNQQEVTEQTEDRFHLHCLRGLLFKISGVARFRRTTKITDRRYLAHKTAQTPRNVPEAQTAVRCSAIDTPTISKISGQNASSRRDGRPNHGLGNVTTNLRSSTL